MSSSCAGVNEISTELLGLLGNVSNGVPASWSDPPVIIDSAAFAGSLVYLGILLVVVLIMWLRARGSLGGRRKKKMGAGGGESALRSVMLQQEGGDDAIEPMRLSFENLGLKLTKGGKNVLQGVNGELLPATLTAVMGPSGSGKSTFLSALSGRVTYGKIIGKTLINGQEDALANHKLLTGFVPQEDVMIRSLTVYETLLFSARARLDRKYPRRVIEELVMKIAVDLDLVDVLDSPIGDENVRGISGGQRKRVNLGIELVSDPKVLLLDEPTSGLDSSGSMDMLRVLRRLAARSKITVAAVIHQPSAQLFAQFDRVLLFQKGGRCVFFGSVGELPVYFEPLIGELGYNPIDTVMDAISSSSPAVNFADAWLEHCKVRGSRMSSSESESNLLLDDSSSEVALQSDHRRQPARAASGSTADFFAWMFLCAGFPPLIFSLLLNRSSQASLRGAIVGVCICLIVVYGSVFALFFALSPYYRATFANALAQIPMLVLSSLNILLAATVLVIYLAVGRRKLRTSPYLALVGWMLGPVIFLGFFWIRSTKKRYAMIIGWALWLAITGISIGLIGPELQFMNVNTSRLGTIVAQTTWVLSLSLSLTCLVVCLSRWKRIPLDERRIATFWEQVWLQLRRYYLQMTTAWFTVAFDLGLPFFTGLMTACLFYAQPWQAPLVESSSLALGIFHCYSCWDLSAIPDGLDGYPTVAQRAALCKLMSLSDDIFPRVGLMATLGLSLVAVASSLRVFGENKANFSREQASGLSTGAFYVGGSIGHLGVAMVATLGFLLPFHAILGLQGSFGHLYAMLLMVYLSASGVGFFCSVLFSEGLGTVFSILGVLVMMLFGGSLYVHGVATPDSALQFALWVPSFLSPLRWAYELFYLIVMEPYRQYLMDPLLGYAIVLYGFSVEAAGQCWFTLGLLLYLFRLLPFLALVSKEKY